MSDLNNSAVVKIIKNKTKEYNDLLKEHNTLLEVHTKMVNDLFIFKDNMREYLDENAGIEAKRYKLKKENVELRKLLKQAESDCKIAQESLDGAQREIERLLEKIDVWLESGDSNGIKFLIELRDQCQRELMDI